MATGKPTIDLIAAREITRSETSNLKVTGIDALSGAISLTYRHACGSTNHNIVFGPLPAVGGYGYTGQICGIGASGTHSGFDPGSGSFFSLVVGTDGGGHEDSAGLASDDTERREDLLDPICVFVQDLGKRCDP